MAQAQAAFKLVTENRKAYHDYFVLDRIEAAQVLDVDGGMAVGTPPNNVQARNVQARPDAGGTTP